MTRLPNRTVFGTVVLAVASALMAVATLVYATHRRVPEYRMGDWDEDDEGVQPWDAPQHPGFVRESPRVWRYDPGYQSPPS